MENTGPALYSAAQARELDHRAIDDYGIPGYTLMQRAAKAGWIALRDRWPQARHFAVFCGSGNNGGDGYEIARLALADRCVVRVFELDDVARQGDAAKARAGWLEIGTVSRWAEHDGIPTGTEVIVDAIFGTGLSRAPQGMAAAAIAAINAARERGTGVIAADLPSGLNADTGAAPGVVVDADLTATFIGHKAGLHTGQGPAHAGAVVLDTLDVPRAAFDSVDSLATLIATDALAHWLPRRVRTAHKGDNGHVLLIGGDHGMAGAILLAARGAQRAGAGLVTVATRASHLAALTAAQPEIMFRAADTAEELEALLDRADVVAIGPGLGQLDWGRTAFEIALTAEQPMVVDADALNLLADTAYRRDDWVLTPHPGEAGRLLGVSTREVQADRFKATAALRARYGGVCILKGAGSLIQGERVRVCPFGNPGMGVGGMGDALTGIVAAFVGQFVDHTLDLETAAAAAVTAHARAGDHAAESGERGLAASDLIDALRGIVNP